MTINAPWNNSIWFSLSETTFKSVSAAALSVVKRVLAHALAFHSKQFLQIILQASQGKSCKNSKLAVHSTNIGGGGLHKQIHLFTVIDVITPRLLIPDCTGLFWMALCPLLSMQWLDYVQYQSDRCSGQTLN